MRPDWDDYFLGIAKAVAARAECSRRLVGAVLVKDNRIRATGYNGAPAGAPSCLNGHCPRAFSNVKPGSSYDTGAGSCIAVHAEANVLLYARRDDCEGATLYITDDPCGGCERLILGSGVTSVVTPTSRFVALGGSLHKAI
jgi:dCMP deaminase